MKTSSVNTGWLKESRCAGVHFKGALVTGESRHAGTYSREAGGESGQAGLHFSSVSLQPIFSPLYLVLEGCVQPEGSVQQILHQSQVYHGQRSVVMV